MSATRLSLRKRVLAIPVTGVFVLAGCGGDGTDGESAEAESDTETVADEGGDDEEAEDGDEQVEASGDAVDLSFAHSYSTEHAHHVCGAELVAEALEETGTGIGLEIFPNSELGPDGPDRVSAVASGDISVDIQGASAIAALYEPIGAMDAAYVFDDVDHVFAFADSPAFEEMRDDMVNEIGVRILDVWYFGSRNFTANEPIRTPEDLDGLRMRFPQSPQYLQNAEAMGADATAVAFEEVYLSLQQGVIDGQENPIPTIRDMNFDEVQSHVSLSHHMIGFVAAIVGEETWQALSPDQQQALHDAISGVRAQNRECLEQAEQEIVDEWKAGDAVRVVEDVDQAAFSAKAEAFFAEELEGDKLALYEAIRGLDR